MMRGIQAKSEVMDCEVEPLPEDVPRWQIYQRHRGTLSSLSVSGGPRFRMTSLKIKIIPSFIQLEMAVSSLAYCNAAAATSYSRLTTRNIYFRPELTERGQSLNQHQEDSSHRHPQPQAGEEGTKVKTNIVSFHSYSYLFLFSSN